MSQLKTKMDLVKMDYLAYFHGNLDQNCIIAASQMRIEKADFGVQPQLMMVSIMPMMVKKLI